MKIIGTWFFKKSSFKKINKNSPLQKEFDEKNVVSSFKKMVILKFEVGN